jgi:hypothetical protein
MRLIIVVVATVLALGVFVAAVVVGWVVAGLLGVFVGALLGGMGAGLVWVVPIAIMRAILGDPKPPPHL